MGQGTSPHMAGKKVENGEPRAHHPRPRATGVESERMFGKNVVKNSRAPAKCTNPILESALFLYNITTCNLLPPVVYYHCQEGMTDEIPQLQGSPHGVRNDRASGGG